MVKLVRAGHHLAAQGIGPAARPGAAQQPGRLEQGGELAAALELQRRLGYHLDPEPLQLVEGAADLRARPLLEQRDLERAQALRDLMQVTRFGQARGRERRSWRRRAGLAGRRAETAGGGCGWWPCARPFA